MTDQAEQGRSVNWLVLCWIVIPLLLLGMVFVATWRGGDKTSSGEGGDASSSNREEENFLAQARTTLARQTDLASYRSVIQSLNSHLQRHPDPASSSPDAS
ncbi:MAG: hypothetical protein ACKO23_13805, partial [Gemmataceae bacterium]